MIHRQTVRKVGVPIVALLMAVAPSLTMAVHRQLEPDASDLGGYVYQIIGRLIPDIRTDSLTIALVFIGALWLSNRYLFHKPGRTGVGEYLLCGFFSVTMLSCASIRATGSVQTLYSDGFQVLKTAVYLSGMFPLFLCALRALNEWLCRPSAPVRVSLWDRHPFAFPLAVLSPAWVVHVVAKYPGVLAIDTVLPIKQFMSEWPRTTAHPPFGTFFYGLMYAVGLRIGNVNIVYFAVMLLQVTAFLLVLSYALWLMKTRRAPFWVQVLSLVLFALSPIYIGWAVVLIKDTPFLILSVLTGVLLLEFLCDPESFLRKKSRWVLIAAGFTLMMLTRYNGVSIVVPALLALLIVMLVRRIPRRTVISFILMACLVFGLSAGTNEAIIRVMNIQKIQFYDWLSIPFQQTARVAAIHGDVLSDQEKADIDTMILYDSLAAKYSAADADQVKWTVPSEERGTRSPERYLRVWWKQFGQYPMDYLDAMLNLNYVLFDLQSNNPVYIGLSDPSLYYYIYPDSFCDMSYYDSEAIRPLNSSQLALTEWYFRFSDLPVIGWFASMGFCVDLMLGMVYLCWVNGRKKALIVLIPSLVTAFLALFCSIVYTRYLLPTIGSLPLWFAAYYLLTPASAPDGVARG